MGNKTGWALGIGGAILVAAVAVYLLYLSPPDSPTDDTLRQGALELKEPSMSIDAVLGRMPSGDCNAGDAYARAAAVWEKHKARFKKIYHILDSTPRHLTPDELALCNEVYDKLKPAIRCESMRYTFVHTAKELRVSAFAKGVEELLGLNDVLECLAEHYRRTENYKQVVTVNEHRLVLGWHMMNERARMQMVTAGMDIMQAALMYLETFHGEIGKPGRAEAAGEYNADISTARAAMDAKRKIVWTLAEREDGKKAPQPGDLFRIIEHDQDRTWRVEAILALAVLRHTDRDHRGNMRKINALLDQAAGSDDELIRAAAEVARTRTKEQITADALDP